MERARLLRTSVIVAVVVVLLLLPSGGGLFGAAHVSPAPRAGAPLPAASPGPVTPALSRPLSPAVVGATSPACSAATTCARAGIHPAASGNSWVDITPVETVHPPPLSYASFAYFADFGEGILFGGFLPGVGATNYTWALKGWSWVNLSATLPSAPPTRSQAQMAYDPYDHEVVLYGGSSGGVNLRNDTWIYDGTKWFNLSTLGLSQPPARYGGGFAFDYNTNTTILFGGTNHAAYYNDTWGFKSGHWTQIKPSKQPAPRSGAVLAWSSAAGADILFGGTRNVPGPTGGLADTWEYASGSWTKLSSSNPPADRWGAVGAESSVGQIVNWNFLLFGGFQPDNCVTLGDTWNLSAGQWSQQSEATAPAPRDGASMIWDAGLGYNVLFGGEDKTLGCPGGDEFNDTWVYGPWSGPAPTPFRLNLTETAPPGPAPFNATWQAHVTGGIGPYVLNFSFDNRSWGDDFSLGWTNRTESYRTSGTYAVTVRAIDALADERVRFATIGVGTEVVQNWYPPRDAYSFGNYGSYWSAGGNCYGYSMTELLYWESTVLGWSGYPQMPNPSATQTSQLQLPTDPKDTLNPTSFGIMLHQIADPRSGMTPGDLDPSSFASSWLVILGWLDLGIPASIGLGPSNGHEVIVYGYQQQAGGTIQMDISDPNNPGATSYAYYKPATENFSYNFGFQWWHFATQNSGVAAPLDPSWVFPSFLADNVSVQEYPTSTLADEFVLADTPVRLVTKTGIADFGKPDDSRTFFGTIPSSIGIEETTLQAYEMPYISSDQPVVFDPSAGASGVAALWPANLSGASAERGAVLTVNSSLPHQLQFQPTAAGFTASVGNVSLQAEVQLFQDANATPTSLRVSELNLSAGSTLDLSVSDWGALNSTTASTTRATVTSAAGVSVSFDLLNGQVGLSPSPRICHGGSCTGNGTPPATANHSTSSGGWFQLPSFALGWVAGAIVAAAVVFLVFRRRPAPPTPAVAPSPSASGPPPGAIGR